MSQIPANRNIGNTGSQHIDDHNALHTAFNNQRLILPVGMMFPSAGGTITDNDRITLPNSGTPGLTTSFDAPDDWATVHVDLQWLASGTSGNFRVTLSGQQVTDNVTIPGATSIGSTTITANHTNWGYTRIATSYALTSGAYHRFLYLSRVSADGADTSTNDLLVYGLVITKAS